MHTKAGKCPKFVSNMIRRMFISVRIEWRRPDIRNTVRFHQPIWKTIWSNKISLLTSMVMNITVNKRYLMISILLFMCPGWDNYSILRYGQQLFVLMTPFVIQVVFSLSFCVGSLRRVRYTIMYLVTWQTVHALARMLFCTYLVIHTRKQYRPIHLLGCIHQ